MSLYNMIFGQNPLAGTLLAIIDLTKAQAGRFRDAFLVKGESGPEVHVYTRNGGGNREHYDEDKEPGADCGCTGCTITYQLPKHPLYLGDVDDEFDCTYATVRFRVPDMMREWLMALSNSEDQTPPGERWHKFFDKLNNSPDDPSVKRVVEASRPLMDALAKAMASSTAGGGPSTPPVEGAGS